MKTKTIVFVAFILIFGALWYWSGSDRANKKAGEASPSMTGSDQTIKAGDPHSRRLEPTKELATVEQVMLDTKNNAGDSFPILNLKIGAEVELPGTGLKLRATDFYTHWNWEGGAVNISFQERNPAVKVDVIEGDSVLYSQWAFKNVPFFGLGGGMDHPGGVSKDLAFTLVEYKGLKIPERDEHDHSAHAGFPHGGDSE